jgi:broad specificity phosphatase PhoE
MTKFLLIRHAAHDLLGKVLAGRAPGVHLNAQGKQEAERLADRLAVLSISAIYTGPLERARETAEPLSNRLHLKMSFAPAFDEVEFGSWTLLPFSALEQRPDWKAWNEHRDRSAPPQGESIVEVRNRASKELERLAESRHGETLAIISHAEVIKSTLMHYLGIPVNFHWRLDISPGSVSVLTIQDGQPQVLVFNSREPENRI